MTYERYQQGAGRARPDELQADLREIRGEMERTLSDISAKLTPDQLMRQLMDSIVGGGGGRFVKNLSRSVESNPIPVAMIASGFGYLLYQDSQRRKQGDGAYESGDVASGDASEANGDGGVRQRAQQALGSAKSHVEGASTRAKEAASGARHAASGAAQRASAGASQVADEASRLTDRAASAARRAAHDGQELLHEQPMVLAGLGVALGAAIAGAAPVSQRERELVGGPASEALDKLERGASRTVTRGRSIAEAAVNAAKDEAAAHAPDSDKAMEAVKRTADQGISAARQVGRAAREAARDEASRHNTDDPTRDAGQ